MTHDRDFRRFSQLLPPGLRNRFRAGAGRISLAVREDDAASRLAEVMDVVEWFYRRERDAGRRLLMTVTPTSVAIQDKVPMR